MQIRSARLSKLRQELSQLYETRLTDLAPFLAGEPMTRGTVYVLRRKCSKASCRCARGELHEGVVLSASIKGRTRLWTIPEERIEEMRLRTERYRQLRRARSQLIRRQRELLRVIDAIEDIQNQAP
jgi:hypothetical protein